MKLNRKTMNKGFTLVELLVVIAIIAALAAMSTPVIMKQKKKADMATTINNAKQIFLLMVEFDNDFAEFPSDNSAMTDDALNGYVGSNSNNYLGQFLAGGYVQSEEVFAAKGGSASGNNKKPDNVFTSTTDTLEAGECGFAYVTDQSTSENTSRTIIMAPMLTGGATFDPNPYGGRAISLRIDGSVQTSRIDPMGIAKGPDNNDLFATGADSVWGSDTVNVVVAE